MKNVRRLPLNLQDFCLMWLIISVSDRNGIKTWKRGPRGGVLDRAHVGGGYATGTVVIPQWEGRNTYMEWQGGVTPQSR